MLSVILITLLPITVWGIPTSVPYTTTSDSVTRVEAKNRTDVFLTNGVFSMEFRTCSTVGPYSVFIRNDKLTMAVTEAGVLDLSWNINGNEGNVTLGKNLNNNVWYTATLKIRPSKTIAYVTKQFAIVAFATLANSPSRNFFSRLATSRVFPHSGFSSISPKGSCERNVQIKLERSDGFVIDQQLQREEHCGDSVPPQNLGCGCFFASFNHICSKELGQLTSLQQLFRPPYSEHSNGDTICRWFDEYFTCLKPIQDTCGNSSSFAKYQKLIDTLGLEGQRDLLCAPRCRLAEATRCLKNFNFTAVGPSQSSNPLCISPVLPDVFDCFTADLIRQGCPSTASHYDILAYFKAFFGEACEASNALCIGRNPTFRMCSQAARALLPALKGDFGTVCSLIPQNLECLHNNSLDIDTISNSGMFQGCPTYIKGYISHMYNFISPLCHRKGHPIPALADLIGQTNSQTSLPKSCVSNENIYQPVPGTNCHRFYHYTKYLPKVSKPCPAGTAFNTQLCACDHETSFVCHIN